MIEIVVFCIIYVVTQTTASTTISAKMVTEPIQETVMARTTEDRQTFKVECQVEEELILQIDFKANDTTYKYALRVSNASMILRGDQEQLKKFNVSQRFNFKDIVSFNENGDETTVKIRAPVIPVLPVRCGARDTNRQYNDRAINDLSYIPLQCTISRFSPADIDVTWTMNGIEIQQNFTEDLNNSILPSSTDYNAEYAFICNVIGGNLDQLISQFLSGASFIGNTTTGINAEVLDYPKQIFKTSQ